MQSKLEINNCNLNHVKQINRLLTPKNPKHEMRNSNLFYHTSGHWLLATATLSAAQIKPAAGYKPDIGKCDNVGTCHV